MYRWAVAACLLAGCASVNPQSSGGARDLSVAVGGGDLGGAPDDLADARDLARAGGDGATAAVDLASPPDLMTVTTDMATGCGAGEHVVINEVQTGGAASGSDEFIELYNQCAIPVDVTNWTLVYRASSGVTDVNVVTINKPLGGHGYYLVASSLYGGAAMPDQTYTGGHLAAIGGGLALRDVNLMNVDSVGWGNASNAFVESMPAPAPPAAQSTARIPNGVDTNNNKSDFRIAVTPTPKAPN